MSERQAQAPVDPQFIERWSPRAFSGEPLSETQLRSLFEAARWAPSCFNAQPWRFVYAVNGGQGWDTLLELLIDANQIWAGNAGALVAVIARNVDDRGNPAPTAGFDAGSAWMSMALQAQSMGLISHAMWGFHHDRASVALALPDDYSVQAVAAFGARGDVASLPEKYQEREVPSPRKPLAELAFEGTFKG